MPTHRRITLQMPTLRWTTRSPWTLALLACAAVALLVGGGIATAQHVALATWKPTPATIQSVEMKSHERTSRRRHGSRRRYTVYVPHVRYTYTTAAGERTATAITYLSRFPSEHRDPEDARAWTRDLHAGKSVQAFVNPLDDTDAFLRPAAMGWPYYFVLAGLGLLGGAAWSFLALKPKTDLQPREVPGASPPLYELAPLHPIAERSGALLTTGAISALVTILGTTQVWLLPVDEATRLIYPITGIGISVLLLGLGLWTHLAAKAFGDPRVMLLSPHLAPGAPATVVLEQPARHDIQIADVLVGLVCTRTTAERGYKGRIKHTTTIEHETWASLLPPSAEGLGTQGSQTTTHRTVRGAVQLQLPQFAPPTTPPDAMGARVDWAVVIKCNAPKAADYAGSFPVAVAA